MRRKWPRSSRRPPRRSRGSASACHRTICLCGHPRRASPPDSLKSKGCPQRRVIDVLAGGRFFEERTGEEMRIHRRDEKVPCEGPFPADLHLVADVALARRVAGSEEVYCHTVKSVAGALAPEKIPVGEHPQAFEKVEVDARMDVDDVRRPDERSLAEVGAAREQSVERLKPSRAWIVVTACDVGLDADARRKRKLQCAAAIDRDRPCVD